MGARQAVYGEIARVLYGQKGPEVVGITGDLLLSRLLFFDQYVLKSVRLGEIPFLIKLFGKEGFIELLDRGLLRLSCEYLSVVTDIHLNGKRHLPLLQFSQGIANTPHHEKTIADNLRCLQSVSCLSRLDRVLLEEKIATELAHLPSDYGEEILQQIRRDLRSNEHLLKAAALTKAHGDISSSDLQISSDEISTGVFRLETNLGKLCGLSSELEHAYLDSVVKAICHLNQRVGDMKAFSVLSSFQDAEAELLFGKFSGIVANLNPEPIERNFLRVTEFSDIPQLVTVGRIDVARLIEARESDECVQFRAWLGTLDELSDNELEKLLQGVRARLGNFLHSKSGKTIRFATNLGLGFLPHGGTIFAAAEGALDSFLLDDLLPNSGILSFLNHTCPSLFDRA